MSIAEWVGIVLAVCWAGTLFCAVGLCRVAMQDDDADEQPVLFAAGYVEGLDRLRVAIAEARIETAPGNPSADLTDCWSIWPDAPTHAGEDGTR
ncbi:hypothetical protein OG912_17010 [Streptomyces sp. NBC_00464]|uniref:hypothetical protein n=1 Tax=Streptomyces sp. NBC_00464 TaxID=2975751 RepID=UPI002E185399